MRHDTLSRRRMLALSLAAGGYALASPLATLIARERGLRRTPAQIEGPFYPVTRPLEEDADLTAVSGRTGRARGQLVYLAGRVLDLKGGPVAGARVEVWQANSYGRYAHPHDRNDAPLDPDFQGFGVQRTDAQGRFHFKTVKPGPYPIPGADAMRTPHIHFQVRTDANRFVTQMYFEGEPLNADDFELRRVAEKELLIARPLPPPPGREPGALTLGWDIHIRR